MRLTIPHGSTVSQTDTARGHAPRRGIALMLVVVTLATATILTTSYLVATESAPSFGQAAQDRATTEWAARSAAGIVEAAMETSADWRTIAAAGMLLDGKTILGAEVSVAMTGLDGTPTTDDDTHVLMTVIAKAGGIESIVQRVMIERDPGTYEEALDPELKEFGVYARSKLSVQGTSSIAAWELSPAVRAGDRGKVGLGFDSATDLTAPVLGLPHDSFLYYTPSASAGLRASVGGYKVTAEELQVLPWATTVETPASFAAASELKGNDAVTEVTADTDLPGGRYTEDVTVSGGARLNLDAANGVFLFAGEDMSGAGLTIDTAKVRIVGDVVIGVYDDLNITDTVFAFDTDATLTVYYSDKVVLDNVVLGAAPSVFDVAGRTHEDVTRWVDPRRVRFMQINRNVDIANDQFVMSNNSVVIGSIHAAGSKVVMNDQSALIGRVSAGELELNGDARLLIDPVFDTKLGLTSKDTSPLYDIGGTLVPGLATAMEATTDSEGFGPAVLRVLSAMPAQVMPNDDPVNGASKRHAGTVKRLREWPVLVRLQEDDDDEDVFYEVPRDETVAAAFGDVAVSELSDTIVEEGGSAIVADTTRTLVTVDTLGAEK